MPNFSRLFHKNETIKKDNTFIFWGMLIGAVLSLIAAFVLSVDAIKIAANPHAELSCSVNIVVNCATVAAHPTAHFFGFPNSFLGLMTEPVVITVAIAGLAGIKFPRKFMFAAQIGYTLGFLFAYFLFYISMFVIQALCPWCLLVTLSTTLVFFSITRYNIREDNLYLPKKASHAAQRFVHKNYDIFTLVLLVVICLLAIVLKYGKGLFV